jgi:hypothetical protein
MAATAAALRAAHKALVVAAAKNGRAIPCDVDTTAFLLANPRGAYTSARTVEQTRVFDYEGHLKRLGGNLAFRRVALFMLVVIHWTSVP